ncbi:MAG: ECF transporter S component [Oscillospiraceae bacterium]|nr:ECF transporter S component [Oscillospiraceae bacterium]
MKRLRAALCYLLPLLMIPIAVGVSLQLPTQYTALMIFIVAALTLLLFVCGIEQKAIGTRRLVLSVIFMALAVLGRMLPMVKPVTAIIILGALYLGKESGFLIGAGTALLSNVFFGQGPWTVFQMLAWGCIGWGAGAMHRALRRHKALLLIYGCITGIAYSMLMDIWTVVWHYEAFSFKMYRVTLLAALPYTMLYAFSNVLFLWLMHKPVDEKLSRIEIKYGL